MWCIIWSIMKRSQKENILYVEHLQRQDSWMEEIHTFKRKIKFLWMYHWDVGKVLARLHVSNNNAHIDVTRNHIILVLFKIGLLLF